MLRKIQWLAPAAVLAMFALLCTPSLRGDDTAATQPSAAANGSITVTVLDSTGKPATGAMVRLMAARTKGEASSATTKPTALRGKTDDNGTFTFSGVAPGEYSVGASVKGGTRGRAKVTLSEGENGAAPTASITVNLPAAQGG